MNPPGEELSYLKKLIRDFPTDIDPGETLNAFQLIAARYQRLEQSYRHMFTHLFRDNKTDKEWSRAFKRIIYTLHRYLFDSILSNAGDVRKTSDPGKGMIGFGGMRHQQQRSRFYGTTPSDIDSELDIACSHLVCEPEDPVENALRFYQHFVYIHPFYDANGRIGRVIVSTYLHLFDLYVQWNKFDGASNAEFINKLNKCHLRMESGYGFEEYVGYLLTFFKNYVISVDELSDFH